jgi:hypothetical protein
MLSSDEDRMIRARLSELRRIKPGEGEGGEALLSFEAHHQLALAAGVKTLWRVDVERRTRSSLKAMVLPAT